MKTVSKPYLFLTVPVILLVWCAVALADKPAPVLVVIKGKITNLAKAKRYFGSDTRLQILAVNPKKGPEMVKRRGKLIFKTNLPKSGISSRGHFGFSNISLLPGHYWLVVQPLARGRTDYGQASRLKMTGMYIVLYVETGNGPPQEFSLGDVRIALPK